MRMDTLLHYERLAKWKQLTLEQENLNLRTQLYFTCIAAVVEAVFVIGLLLGRI